MRITITDSSVVHIETTDGISINMFVETAAVLYKTLGPILDACGHGNRALETVEAGQPDVQQLQAKIRAYYAELNNMTDVDGILISDVMARLREISAVQ
jgi:hypothetical protein